MTKSSQLTSCQTNHGNTYSTLFFLYNECSQSSFEWPLIILFVSLNFFHSCLAEFPTVEEALSYLEAFRTSKDNGDVVKVNVGPTMELANAAKASIQANQYVFNGLILYCPLYDSFLPVLIGLCYEMSLKKRR